MKNVDDMLPNDNATVGEVIEAVAGAVAVVLATSLPNREAAIRATVYMAECLCNSIQKIDEDGGANWSEKSKGDLQ